MAERALPFRTDHEDGCVPGAESDRPAAALTINPEALPVSLAAAALARADTLRRSLLAWSCISGAGCVEASEVAQTLEPNAHEVLLLLDALVMRLRKAEAGAQPQGAHHG